MEQIKSDYHFNGGDEGVLPWLEGLPDADKLTPLSQSLISQNLASAFRISTEPCRSISDVNSASKTTIMNIRGGQLNNAAGMVDPDDLGPDSRKLNEVSFVEESNLAPENLIEDAALARTLKRPRVAWTPQLHKRFVDVVSHLGLKDAAPKAIMQLMNVEGLTRENIASHLQKYRLYLKRTQISDEALVPIPATHNSHVSSSSVDSLGNGYFPATFPMNYAPSPMMPMMFYGMGAHGHGINHAGVPMVNMSTVPTHSSGSKGQQD